MKKILAGLLAAALLGAGTVAAGAQCLVTGENYGVGASAAVVMEAVTGEVLFSQNPRERLPIASTTKIMTALLALEQPGLDGDLVVDPQARRVAGGSMGLQEGDTVTLRALAGGMLAASGNDGANAAAVRIAGSVEAFAGMMNERAAQIGMRDSNFVTPSGLDAEGHYSTAYDMALLGREALQNPVFAEICAAKSVKVTFGSPPYERSLINHNRLLRLYQDCVGIKTGFTKKAGRCLVSAASRDGVTLICVTMNCPDDWDTHQALYERYFPMVTMQELVPEGTLAVPVAGGTAPEAELVQTESFCWPAIQGRDETIVSRAFVTGFLYAPVLDGDIVGKMVYYIGETPIWESPLAVSGAVPARPAERKKSIPERIRGALFPQGAEE